MIAAVLGLSKREARAAWPIAKAQLLMLFRGVRKPGGGYHSPFGMTIWSNLIGSLVMTLMAGEFLELGACPLIWMAMGFFFVGSTVAGDFAVGILEHEDTDILMHQPISSRALFAGRLLQVLVVLGLVTGAFFVAPAFGGWELFGWSPVYPLLFLFMGALETAFLTLAVIGLYVFLLRWIHVEKVKALAGWINVLLTLGFVLSYQLQSGWIAVGDLAASARWSWISYLIPPAWFSAPVEMLASGWSLHLTAQGLLAIAATGLLGKVVLGFLSRSYSERLGAALAEQRLEVKGERCRFLRWARRLFRVKPGAERAGFDLVFHHRKTVRAWASSAFFVTVLLVSVWQKRLPDPYGQTDNFGFFFSFFQAMLGMIAVGGVQSLKYSPHWKASWCLRTSPAVSFGSLWSGAKKALLFLYTPIFLGTFIALSIFWGVLHSLFFVISSWLLGTFLAHLASCLERDLPASVEPMTTRNSGRIFIFTMASMFIGMLSGGLQFLLSLVSPWFFLLHLAIMLAAAWLMALISRWILNKFGRWEETC